MATKYNICRTIVNIKVCAKFEIFQVKVPPIFSRHAGFLGTQGCALVLVHAENCGVVLGKIPHLTVSYCSSLTLYLSLILTTFFSLIYRILTR